MVRLFATHLLLFIVFNFAIISSRSDGYSEPGQDASQMGHKVNDLESDHDNGIVLDHNNGETHSFSNPSEYASKYPHEDVTQQESHATCLPLSVFIYALGGLSTAIGVVSFALGLYTAYAYLRSKKQIAAPNEQEDLVSSTVTKNDVRLPSTLIAFPEKRKIFGQSEMDLVSSTVTKNDVRLSSTLIALPEKRKIFGQSEMESVADTTDLRSFPVKEDKKIDDKNESNEQKTKAPNVHNEDESSPDRNPVRLL
ncbi:hypothetical protein Tcan_06532 [Toxocara canis]|uniref:Transmembrane protein n=1 Tax=Toxocara canis TaxID=6265 RepID=A0A0B2VQ24_TOXCA|nr:hypothetical protein Tcan_06532 [Toxocara canis]